jgi:hypothetical protein
MNAGDFPVPGRAVLSRRCRSHASPRACCVATRRDAFERFDVPQSESLEPRQLEATDFARDVAERITSDVAVIKSVRRFADSDAVQNYDRRSLQVRLPV